MPERIGLEFGLLFEGPKWINIDTDDLLYYENFNKYFDKIYEDDGCVEFVTTPISYNRAIEVYKFIKKQKYFSFHLPNEMSGGLHINLDICDEEIANRYLILDTSNRPYLNWCLNDPVDDINANPITPERTWDWYSASYIKTGSYRDFINKPLDNIKYLNAINYRGNRLEFRFFDTPYNLKEFKNFMDIAIAMKERAKYLSQKLPLPKQDKAKIKNKKVAWLLFQDFINELEIKNPSWDLWEKRLDERWANIECKYVKHI